MDYDWPGNVRELENIIERALILNPVGSLSFSHLLHPQEKASTMPETEPSHIESLEIVMRNHIILALEKAGGKIHGPGGAAELLDINPSTSRNRMLKLGIPLGQVGQRPTGEY